MDDPIDYHSGKTPRPRVGEPRTLRISRSFWLGVFVTGVLVAFGIAVTLAMLRPPGAMKAPRVSLELFAFAGQGLQVEYGRTSNAPDALFVTRVWTGFWTHESTRALPNLRQLQVRLSNRWLVIVSSGRVVEAFDRSSGRFLPTPDRSLEAFVAEFGFVGMYSQTTRLDEPRPPGAATIPNW